MIKGNEQLVTAKEEVGNANELLDGQPAIVGDTEVGTPQSENEKLDHDTPKYSFKKTFSTLIKFCRPWYPLMLISLILAVGTVVIHLIAPTLVEDMVNYIMRGILYRSRGLPVEYGGLPNFYSYVLNLGIILAILYVSTFVIGYIMQFIMASVTRGVQVSLRSRMSGKINKLPLKYLDKKPTGDILSRITTDVDSITATLNFSVTTLISGVTMIIGSAIMMFVTNWIMAFVAIGASLLAFSLMALITARTQKYFVRQQKELGDVNAHIEEYFSGHNVLKTNNARAKVGKEFDRLNHKLFSSNYKSQFYGGLLVPLMIFVSMFSLVAVSIVGGVLAFNDYIEFGVIVSFMIYVSLFSQPFSDLAFGALELQSTLAAGGRVFELLEADEMEEESCCGTEVDKIKGDVIFENVNFGYDENKTIIHDFNAEIPAGSKVAIVGPTGAGKTTLVNLLMKFYNIDSGDIRIDGKSIKDIKRGKVANLFSMVLQDAWLFHGTIRQNLLYNIEVEKGSEQELIEKATKACGIDYFIKTLPKGYDTVLDDKASVSDGQKQLLTIARAMIKDAPLLILDEATSSVDTRTEIIVKEAMDKLTAGRTSFVIAHRLSTIKNADMILVLRDGDIVEKGTHKALLKQKGFYSELYNAQFAA